MHTLVIIRHGESQWNKLNLFCGWTDVDLTETGYEEAHQAGRLLREGNYHFDICYTSVLKRAIHTAYTVLDELDLTWIPMVKDYHLNERHYGALQGLNKKETAEKYGDSQVHLWRRSYDVRPPALPKDDERNPAKQAPYQRYKGTVELPLTECLKDTVARVAPYFESEIKPKIELGENVLITAHGNSIRALRKYLEDISDDEIAGMNIPTGVPLVYHLNEDFTVDHVGYLGDEDIIRAKIDAVKMQSVRTEEKK